MTEEEVRNLNRKDKILRESARILSVGEKDFPRVLERFLREIEDMESKRRPSS